MVAYFLDTDVCITLIRGVAPTSRLRSPDKCVLPTVTSSELWLGAEKKRPARKAASPVDAFIHFFSELPFDKLAARHYGQIRADLEREGTPIDPLDQLIGAHALQRARGLRCLR
jgi:tRNA(fMet)-specific endonuclease VapC